MRRLFVFMLFFLAIPQKAHAEWLESASTHFVIYGNSSEANLRKLSDQLERYHAGMAFMMGADTAVPSPSGRVTVFIVGSMDEVRKLHRGKERNIAGFYVPRAGASLAVIPSVRSDNGGNGGMDFPMIVLLHEYAHHFLISSGTFPMPRWMSEGAAEFFASASFGKDGSLALGRPAMHRGYELFEGIDVTTTDLLDPDHYEKRRGKNTEHDAFYGKSWLLYHYLVFNGARSGQLKAYTNALVEGKGAVEAGRSAFGDFAVLEKELDAYLRQRKMSAVSIRAATLKSGPVTIRQLTSGEKEVLPLRIRSTMGVDSETAPGILADARAVATRFPSDPAVLAELAEAEHDAGNDDESIAAADAAIKINPGEVNAYIQKGYSLLRKAEKSGEAAQFDVARNAFLALNAIENDHPIPLIYFYRSFVQQMRKPTKNAVNALERASQISPFDLDLRMMLAMQQLRDGRREDARTNLVPVAYNPHGGKGAEIARAVMTRMDADKDWNGSGMVMPE